MNFAHHMLLEHAPINMELSLDEVSDPILQIKLLELGFSERSNLRLIRKAPFNGPYTIGNHKTQIILRKEDAKLISVSKVG